VHVAYRRGSVFLRRSGATPIKRKLAILGVFFLVDNALYSTAFETHTKTVKPIEIPFELITRVGPRYHVLDGDLIPKGKGQFWGKK